MGVASGTVSVLFMIIEVVGSSPSNKVESRVHSLSSI